MRVSQLGSISLLCLTTIFLFFSSCCGKQAAEISADFSSNQLDSQDTLDYNPLAETLPDGLVARISLEASEPAQDWQRALYASEYKRELPAKRVDTTYSHSIEFNPNYDPAQPDARSLAYAIYVFPLAGLEIDPVLNLSWETRPADSSDIWIGLADFTKQRWQWLDQAGCGPYPLPDIEQFIEPYGQLVLIMVLSGTDEAMLNWLRIGGNAPPRTNLLADGQITPRGEVVIANALDPNWIDPDGDTATYRFDLDGDGEYETDTGTTHYAKMASPSSPFPHTTGIEVTDNQGATSYAQTTVEVSAAYAETIASGYYYRLELAADSDRSLHLLCRVHDSGFEGLEYFTYAAGSWQSERVCSEGYVSTMNIALDSTNKPWICKYLFPDETLGYSHQFLSREETGWTEHPDMRINSHYRYPANLHLAFDSENNLHLGYGADCDWVYSPPLVYSIFAGGSWSTLISGEPAFGRLDMALAPDNTAWFLFGKTIHTIGGDDFRLMQFGHLTAESWEHETIDLYKPFALAMTSTGEPRYIKSIEDGVIDNDWNFVTDETGFERFELAADSDGALHAVLIDECCTWQDIQPLRLAYAKLRSGEWEYDYQELRVSGLRKVVDVSLAIGQYNRPAIAVLLRPVDDRILPIQELTEIVMIRPD